jgi:hypothetical protein
MFRPKDWNPTMIPVKSTSGRTREDILIQAVASWNGTKEFPLSSVLVQEQVEQPDHD